MAPLARFFSWLAILEEKRARTYDSEPSAPADFGYLCIATIATTNMQAANFGGLRLSQDNQPRSFALGARLICSSALPIGARSVEPAVICLLLFPIEASDDTLKGCRPGEQRWFPVTGLPPLESTIRESPSRSNLG